MEGAAIRGALARIRGRAGSGTVIVAIATVTLLVLLLVGHVIGGAQRRRCWAAA